MLLIAESGSTTTDWCLVDASHRLFFRTPGINPFMESASEIVAMIQKDLLPHLQFPPIAINFYGAGCVHQGKETVLGALKEVFRGVEVDVQSDLLAAARGLCGHASGIACILGTGSNSCYFDGFEIIENVSPLGFILGDEGSGAVLGKRFVGALLKNQFSEELKEQFLCSYQLGIADIIERVYRRSYPNRFLASFAPFIHQNLHHAAVRQMVKDEFDLFVTRNILQYSQTATLPIHFTGSIAWYFSDILKEVLEEKGLKVGTICVSPLQQLIDYHQRAML